MNSRFLKTLLLASVVVGGIWVLFHRDRINEPSDILVLVKEQFSKALALEKKGNLLEKFVLIQL